MAGKQAVKLLTLKAIEMMKLRSASQLRFDRRQHLFYLYTSSLTNKLTQVKIGNFPYTSLAVARIKLDALRQIRQQGRCPRR